MICTFIDDRAAYFPVRNDFGSIKILLDKFRVCYRFPNFGSGALIVIVASAISVLVMVESLLIIFTSKFGKRPEGFPAIHR